VITRILTLTGALMVFGTINWQVAGKEHLRVDGQVVYLDLAPKDPRSLMQGDYMALNFGVTREIARQVDLGQDGPHVAVLRLNERRIGDFVRLDTGGSLNPGEVRFRFRIRRGEVWLGTNAFFFHEGEAERYQGARFGEFRVNESGEAMLVDVRDKDLQKMPGGDPSGQ
jgi:uncharacterized membrane-anchored protein